MAGSNLPQSTDKDSRKQTRPRSRTYPGLDRHSRPDHGSSWDSLLTPPTTPPAETPWPAPEPRPSPVEPQNHDPYLHGTTIHPAELIHAEPPVPRGSDDCFQSFVFQLRVPRDYTQPLSLKNSHLLHAEILRKSSQPTPPSPSPSLLTPAPLFAYLCGGPGSGQQPDRHELLSRYVVANGFQMLLLDYRGCGRSQPLTVATVLARRQLGGTTAAVRAFHDLRQGNIVRDLEAVRLFLLGLIVGQAAIEHRLVLLGQSYGGWIAITYVDRYPRSVRAVLLTGGMPPLGAEPDEVYGRLFDEVATKNEAFYDEYPDAVDMVRRIAAGILSATGSRAGEGHGDSRKRRRDCEGSAAGQETGGDRLSLATFASLGRILGEPGGAAKLYRRLRLIEGKMMKMTTTTTTTHGAAVVEDPEPLFDYVDTHRFNQRLPYAFDHEIQCYVMTEERTVSWAAKSVRDARRRDYGWINSTSPEELESAGSTTQSTAERGNTDEGGGGGGGGGGRMHFLGEAFMPEHAEDYSSLRALGGRAFADAVAAAGQTETLFDMARLAANAVPVFAIVYHGDMYVDADLAAAAARRVGAARCVRLDEESGLRHNAVRESADRVVAIFRAMGFTGFERDP